MRVLSPTSKSLVILQIVGIGHLVDHLLRKEAVIIMLTKYYWVKHILEDTYRFESVLETIDRRIKIQGHFGLIKMIRNDSYTFESILETGVQPRSKLYESRRDLTRRKLDLNRAKHSFEGRLLTG